ncbi:MAG: DUF2029 domain-containing protein [Actinomycetota bacterium]|nr:DUF2029 domain-containing protein [Actinomycetota bacterium]
MRSTTSWAPNSVVLATAVFVALSVATTGVVRASGRQIIDTPRYERYAEAMQAGLVPYRDFDFEYPPGALLVFLLPELAGGGYFWAFAALMAVAGAIGLILSAAALRRLARPREVSRRLALLALSPAVFGGVLLTRFDLVPAMLVAGATLLLLMGWPRFASLVIGVAVAVKLYPLVLVPLVAGWAWRRQGRWEAVVCCGLAVGVVALAYLPFVLLAPGDVASSIWGQISRPLQIESLGAGVLLLLHHALGVDVGIETKDGSQNLTGATAVGLAFTLSAATIAALCWLWMRFARSEMTPERLVTYCAAVLVALVAFGKVLSPQFLVWLLFPLAVVVGKRGAAAGACFAVAAVATAVWFPWLYFDLAREGDPVVGALIVLRGLALVTAVAVLVWPSGVRHPTAQ